jgi:D-tyrosyl-tRNA(Tyr) deacylase
MRAVLQRVSRASVTVEGAAVARIGAGLLLFVGAGRDDRPGEPERLADKIAHLRVFADAGGRMNRSVLDVGGEVLVVSQFTLYADVRKGRRPSWAAAAEPEVAAGRVEELARALEGRGLAVGRGVFGAHMEVELLNDGPVTVVLDGADLAR